MKTTPNDDFYVGYLPKAPARLGKIVARIAAGVLLAGLIAGGLLIFGQPRFATSKFEYGEYRDYAGVDEGMSGISTSKSDMKFGGSKSMSIFMSFSASNFMSFKASSRSLRSERSWLTISTAISLATSPAACPPMPSATIKSPR